MSVKVTSKAPADYRKRLRYLLWSIVPALMLCYFMGFSKTFGVIAEYRKNDELRKQAGMMGGRMQLVEEKRGMVRNWHRQYLLDSSGKDAGVLSSVSRSCEEMGLQLKAYRPVGVDARHIWSRVVTIEGDFHSLLRLVFLLEEEERVCRIASVKLEQVKEGEEKVLQCDFFIQNILDVK